MNYQNKRSAQRKTNTKNGGVSKRRLQQRVASKPYTIDYSSVLSLEEELKKYENIEVAYD